LLPCNIPSGLRIGAASGRALFLACSLAACRLCRCGCGGRYGAQTYTQWHLVSSQGCATAAAKVASTHRLALSCAPAGPDLKNDSAQSFAVTGSAGRGEMVGRGSVHFVPLGQCEQTLHVCKATRLPLGGLHVALAACCGRRPAHGLTMSPLWVFNSECAQCDTPGADLWIMLRAFARCRVAAAVDSQPAAVRRRARGPSTNSRPPCPSGRRRCTRAARCGRRTLRPGRPCWPPGAARDAAAQRGRVTRGLERSCMQHASPADLPYRTNAAQPAAQPP